MSLGFILTPKAVWFHDNKHVLVAGTLDESRKPRFSLSCQFSMHPEDSWLHGGVILQLCQIPGDTMHAHTSWVSMTSKVVFWQMPETSDASPENCNGCCGDRMTSEKSDEICQSAQGVVDHAATWQCTGKVLWELWQTWVLGCFA